LDTSNFAGFTKCCDLHDICYDTCNNDRTQCDDDFKSCLDNECLLTEIVEASDAGSLGDLATVLAQLAGGDNCVFRCPKVTAQHLEYEAHADKAYEGKKIPEFLKLVMAAAPSFPTYKWRETDDKTKRLYTELLAEKLSSPRKSGSTNLGRKPSNGKDTKSRLTSSPKHDIPK
ncbi:hypothetical protein AWC38_SpisGene8838, partial [Stylophora pistillata]